MAHDLTLRRVTGPGVAPYLDDVARLRIAVFREYPYLYDGHLDYERRYLRTYSASPESLFVLALDGPRVVGCSTGVPLAHEGEEFQRPFLDAGIDVAGVFYFGESVLLPEHRGKGVGVRFFEEREAHARELGRFQWCAFCAVERPADHPRRPPGHEPLDAFWRRRGYERRPGLRTEFSWKEVGEAEASPKPMVFWMKAIGARQG